MAEGGKGGYSEHDDRVGRGGSSNRNFSMRRRKGRGPFRGKMYSEMNHHQKNWGNAGFGPRSRGEEEDDDVPMADPHDALRSRYTPYGQRPNRPDRERGGLSNLNLMVRKNLSATDRNFDISNATKKTWFKVTIPYGRKYEKAWLLGAIQKQCDVPFVPLEIHYASNRIVFYVEDAAAAQALRHLSRKIIDPEGFKVVFLINSYCPPPRTVHELSQEDIEHLKHCMSKRYDGSQQALDLKSIRTDPDLVAQNLDVVLNRRSCMLAVLRIIEENIPELLSLNLSDNKIYRLDDMASLYQKAPNLKILNLSCNQLRSERDLDKLKTLKLEELWLDNNPLCDTFQDQSSYISAVRERFPKLLRLDGHDLPPPITFDVEAPTTLPAYKGSYFPSDDLKVLILRFLQQYYTIYDSGDRQGLLDAYHDGACCSLSTPFRMNNPSRSNFGDYFKYSRNVKKLKDPTMRFKLLKHTRLNVVAFLSELPKTQHDINSFVVDVCAQTNTLLCFSVNGIFKEMDGKFREMMRAFTRVFIAVPAGNDGSHPKSSLVRRLCIVNDQLFIRKASIEELRKAFVMPAPTPSSSPVPTLSAEQQEMLQNFSLQSGMNLEWSQKCLSDNDWVYAHAAHVFTQLKAQGKIPDVAFLN